MSDDYIYVIPEEPGVVLEEARQQQAVAYFQSIAPKADKVTASVSEHLQFIHAGANFSSIACPSCGAPVEMEAWQEWMKQDFQGKDKGFVLSNRVLPCCGVSTSLHGLRYEWPQGFARLKVCAENPNIGKLSPEHCRQFERLLGTGVRIVYEHM